MYGIARGVRGYNAWELCGHLRLKSADENDDELWRHNIASKARRGKWTVGAAV